MTATATPPVSQDSSCLDDAELLIEQARRRARRRRRRHLAALVAILLIALAILTWARSGPPSHTGPPAALGAAPAAAAVSAMPDFLVAHTPTQTGKPGAIAVYDSRTGRQLRVLGAAYDPYLMNGFV